MKCSRIKKKLSAYLDGEMPEQERIVISEHLQRCEECKAELAGLMKVADSLNILDGVDVPPYFMTRLRQYIKEEAKPVSFLQRIRGVAISAATALAVIVSLFIGNQAGRTLYQSIAQTPEPAMAETNDVFGLSTFEEFPDGSLSDSPISRQVNWNADGTPAERTQIFADRSRRPAWIRVDLRPISRSRTQLPAASELCQ